MKHGSLFSGIGGFDLAAQWMGWKNEFHCEWNDFGKRILKYYWPKAKSYDDITKTNFNSYRGRINVLTGGFPCQPYSTAGKRLGKEDDRHLWPEMLRAIREIQPDWIVGENVFGLVNWNDGLVFQEVQTDLEAEGYEVQPFILPAAGVSAPHQRYRVWFVANSIHNRNKRTARENEEKSFKEWIQEWNKIQRTIKPSSLFRNISNTNGNGLERGKVGFKSQGRNESREEQFEGCNIFSRQNWEEFPIESPIYNGNDGIPFKLDGITVSKWRKESVKAGGNAIVPQLAFQIFKAIEKYEQIINKE